MHKAAVGGAHGVAGVVTAAADGAVCLIQHRDADLTVGGNDVGVLPHGGAAGIGCFNLMPECFGGGVDFGDFDVAVDVSQKNDLEQPQHQQQHRYEHRKISDQLPADADLSVEKR